MLNYSVDSSGVSTEGGLMRVFSDFFWGGRHDERWLERVRFAYERV